jgi:lipopolysaccharide export system protein LptA
MAMTRQLILSTALVAALCTAGAAHAQVGRGDAPIRITAKSSEYLQNEGRGTWAGDVVATQADSQITTDKLTAICARGAQPAKDANKNCDIEKLVAEGNVLYTAPEGKISGDKAEYDTTAHIITFTGDVISSRADEGVMRATQMVYNIDEGSVRMTAGDKRVLAIITPKKKDPAAQPAAQPAGAPAAPPAGAPATTTTTPATPPAAVPATTPRPN